MEIAKETFPCLFTLHTCNAHCLSFKEAALKLYYHTVVSTYVNKWTTAMACIAQTCFVVLR